MSRYIIQRIFSGIIVLLGVSIFSFMLIHFIPGDPVRIMLGQNATPEQMERLTVALGLDRPLFIQYWEFLKGVLQGDLGTSLKTGRPVLTEILDRFPETVKLAVMGMAMAIIIGLFMGTLAAKYQGTIIDSLATGFATLGISIPNFWLGILLMMIFSVKLGWFPIAEGTGLRDLILPSFTLGVVTSTLVSRLTRNGLVEVFSENYIRTARAKGLNEGVIIFRHALRNVLIPIVTILGLQMAALLGGTVIIEQVFNWPGIGTLAIDAIFSRDFPMIQGTVLFMGSIYVVINILVDVSYSIIDPRVDFSAEGEQ